MCWLPTLIIEQPNVMQVFEFRETPEPIIIMAYYHQGNIVNAGIVDEDRYISALGQILDGLNHLHAKWGCAPRSQARELPGRDEPIL